MEIHERLKAPIACRCELAGCVSARPDRLSQFAIAFTLQPNGIRPQSGKPSSQGLPTFVADSCSIRGETRCGGGAKQTRIDTYDFAFCGLGFNSRRLHQRPILHLISGLRVPIHFK